MSACIRCGAKTEATYRFCMSCGYPVQQTTSVNTQKNAASFSSYNPGTKSLGIKRSACIRCGSKLDDAYKFCMSCGYPVKKAEHSNASENVKKYDSYNPGTRSQEVQRVACIRCGSKLAPIDMFCMTCGYPVKQNSNPQKPNNQFQGNTATTQAATGVPNYPVCKKCGERIEITDQFCMACGYPTQQKTRSTSNKGSSANYTYQPTSERDQCIAELNRMCEYFGKVQSKYNEYDICYRSRVELNRKIMEEKDSDFNLSVIGITMSIVGTLVVFFGICCLLDSSFQSALIWLTCGVIAGPGGVFLTILDSRSKNASRRELKMRNKQQVALAKELTKNYADYGYCIVDPEFTNPKILARIRGNLHSGRAKDLNDAIKLLYRDARKKEFMARRDLNSELKFYDRQGANTASAFYPASIFNL